MPTPEEHRRLAEEAEQRREESWDRSDTDGFMSQWASGLAADEHRLAAQIAEAGGRAWFPALFDLDGNLVAAKLIDGRYGLVWGLLESDDPDSPFTGWFNPSRALDDDRARRNNAKKGYYVGGVMARAKADLGGGSITSVRAIAKRIDGGFSRDVEIVDNGHEQETES